jgi:hypothetical protein
VGLLDLGFIKGGSYELFLEQPKQHRRAGKIVADIFCLIVLGTFSMVFFGVLGGILAVVIIEAMLLGLDTLMPNDDHAPAAVVR